MIFFNALFLLVVANGIPVIANNLLGRHFDCPVDGNRKAFDGRPWLGPSKTLRGILLSIAMTAGTAVLLGYQWWVGVLFGALAMGGDLVSSFIKRRFGLPSSSQAPGLDQIPESLFPLWGCSSQLGLSWQHVLLLVGAFWVIEILLSRLLYRLRLRDRPY